MIFQLCKHKISIFKVFTCILSRQPQVQNHLKNVYTCLLGATLCATLGIYLSMTGWLNYPVLAAFASLITSIWLITIDFNASTQMRCFGLMYATALFTGIYVSPLINLAIHVDPQIVMTAFLLTTLIFVCFTLSALLTKKRTYLYLGGKNKNRKSSYIYHSDIYRSTGYWYIYYAFTKFDEYIWPFTTYFQRNSIV